MNRLTTTALFSLIFSVSMSGSAMAEESLFFAEPMTCQGLVRQLPEGMHPSFAKIGIEFTSFKSTRKDGTLADSLEIKTAYAEKDGKLPEEFGSEVWYTGPLRQDEGKVYRKSLSGRDDNLELDVISDDVDINVTYLKGTYTLVETVVGNYVYDVTCKATVVTEPKRVDDYTAITKREAEGEMNRLPVVAQCIDGTREFKIGKRTGGVLVGFFKDFTWEKKGIELFECSRLRAKTSEGNRQVGGGNGQILGYKCLRDPGKDSDHNYEAILRRNATDKPVLAMSLVKKTGEDDGDNYLFGLNCTKSLGF